MQINELGGALASPNIKIGAQLYLQAFYVIKMAMVLIISTWCAEDTSDSHDVFRINKCHSFDLIPLIDLLED